MKSLIFLMELNFQNFYQLLTYAQEVIANGINSLQTCHKHLFYKIFADGYSNDTTGIDPDGTVNDDDEEDAEAEIAVDNKFEDYFACETVLNLFVLQQELFIKGNFPGEINVKNQR